MIQTGINDVKLRMIGIALLAVLISVCFNLFYTIEFGVPLWKVLVSNLIYVFLSVQLTRQGVLYVNKIYRDIEDTKKQLPIILALLLGVAPLLGIGHIHFEKDILFQDDEKQSLYTYLSASGSTFFFTLIIATFYEAWFFFLKWNKAAREKEVYEKASIEAQYELLKNQVQPHFLFNSLNSLTALIDENTKQAKRFIKELSFVYRYLLQSNQHRLITLEEELSFVNAYVFLLKTRFEEGLFVELKITDTALTSLLPPLTLQILLENCVKHNRADKQHPLWIQIRAERKEISVSNNLQRKTQPLDSSRLGLSNISAKYAFLKHGQMLINETADVFCVTLPLLEPQINGNNRTGETRDNI